MTLTLDFLFNHPRHISLIAQWMYEEWGHFYPDASRNKALKWVTKTARLSGLPVNMLALDGQNVAGFAMLQRQELYREKGVTPWLGVLLVRESYKGQGIGKRFEQWAVTYAQAQVRACHQLKDFEAKMLGFENRIAEYIEVFEKRKRRNSPFAAQKTIIDDMPYKKLYLLAFDAGSAGWYSRRGWIVYKVVEDKNYSLTVMQKQLGQAW